MTDSLENLFVHGTEMDLALLGEVLAPYVRLAKQTGQPIPTAAFAEVSAGGKIIVYALARKAGCALGLMSGPEKATPREISEATGVKNGTTKPTVIALAKKGLLVSEGGSYSVPNHALPHIRDAIK